MRPIHVRNDPSHPAAPATGAVQSRAAAAGRSAAARATCATVARATCATVARATCVTGARATCVTGVGATSVNVTRTAWVIVAAVTWVVAATVASCAGTSTPAPTPTSTPLPSVTFTPSVTPTITPSPTPTFPRDAVVEVSSLNVRAGPNTLHPIVAMLGSGTPVAVDGRSHDTSWLSVRSEDSEGWINASFVRLRKAEADIPIVPTPTSPPTPTPTPIPMDPALPLVLLPPVVAQGDPVLVRLRQAGAVQAIATMDETTCTMTLVSDGTFAGIFGVSPDTSPGEHAVHVTAIDAEGNPISSQVVLIVHRAPFDDEDIMLDPERQKLLDPGLRALEEDRLAVEVWSVASTEKQWQGEWRSPVTGTVSSRYGSMRTYNENTAVSRHLGVDFRARPGTPVIAPARGTVLLAEPLEIFGNSVWLDHGWGVQTGYFHLQDILVEPGQVVEPEDTIGTVGASGRVTGPHLHWEVRVRGVPVQPLEFLRRNVGEVP